ncbi:ABC transporter ATP-binding protein [Clostridium ihumii]|uniref:ABC transporter ATP-binding protein n=1 Tax=Clostridium ihumii TaxID=1470356 RepID=UPI003D32FCAE
MNESIMTIENLNFEVQNKHILKNINLEFYKGELVGIIGPNGAGKSTLLKCFNGINTYEGTICIKGKDIKKYEDKILAQNISFMNQNTNINFPFSCEDIILMGRYPYMKSGYDLKESDKIIAKKYMEYMNIIDLREKKITELSGGERQRVLFSKVLTQETDIILLDEPTSNLDIKYQEEIFKYMKKLTEEQKLIVTTIHDLRVAIKYCTKLILIKDGYVIANGKCNEVITEENIKMAYDIDVSVYKNPVTNNLDFCIKDDIT